MHTLEQLLTGKLKGCKSVKLQCGLTSFPPEILDLADTLEMLDLSGNELSSLPDSLVQLKRLKILFCSNNRFTALPAVLGRCLQLDIVGFKANQIAHVAADAIPKNIRWLILTDNCIPELPNSIGNCIRLQKLMLAGNQLRQLPTSLTNCKNLMLLRISANQLQQFPMFLLSLPQLSWLAFAGNPFSRQMVAAEANQALPLINWEHITLTNHLGEGASGMIAKAVWANPVHVSEKTVAVKVFKGAVTSDGFPEDEMSACIAAGTHPNLVQVLGKIHNHPEGKDGLVLGLIPPSFTNLGEPPSFESCTRDVFKSNMQVALTQVVSIAQQMANAVAHLHERGVLHGDLYTHNILIDNKWQALFGDFGAATRYNRNNPALAPYLERIEVQAFGYLLDDLLNLVPKNEQQQPLFRALWRLMEECTMANITERPHFQAVLLKLTEMNN